MQVIEGATHYYKEQPDKLVEASLAPIRLLTGEQDKVGHAEGMRRLGPPVTVLPGLGHNLHVEAPETFWRAIENDL